MTGDPDPAMLDVEQVNNDLIDSQLITPKKGDSGEESGNEDQQESPDTARIKKS